MLLEKILPKTKDNHFHAIVEISQNSDPIKYEFDKNINALSVDRVMQVAMSYPCNYGFVPHTLSEDGDPADILIISQYSIIPGAVIEVRPVGVLIMEDESGLDEKILAVPSVKIDVSFRSLLNITDVSDILKLRIIHFFENYKKLENGKWVKIVGWEDAKKAVEILDQAILRNNDKK